MLPWRGNILRALVQAVENEHQGCEFMTEWHVRGPRSSLTSAPAGHSSEQLGIRTELDHDQVTVFLSGELDLCTAPSFAEALVSADADRANCLVIDLAGLRFIDSSGLRELVVALKRRRGRGGEIVLRSPGPSTLRVLDMVGLSQLFTIR